jgi:uncharacterized protein
MTFQLIKQGQFRQLPWKNGQGFTAEIAIEPSDANSASGEFLWRLSRARIEQSSAFSLFPEHDRKLVILSGAGVMLMRESQPATVLHPFIVFSFPGDQKLECELLDGAVSDFNVFTKKGECAAEVFSKKGAEISWRPRGQWNFAYAVSGDFQIGTHLLGEGDALLVTGEEVTELVAECTSGAEGRLILVGLRKVDGTP